jgi:hypothetical protein
MNKVLRCTNSVVWNTGTVFGMRTLYKRLDRETRQAI